jgi:ornithine carbamoyltransferase
LCLPCIQQLEVVVSFRCRSFLSILDYTPDEIHTMLRLALQLKDDRRSGKPHPVLRGKTLGMIFQKNSTRTRVSFEVGMSQLGGQALFLSANDLQLNRGESIADTARVLGRFLDGIMARTYAHADVVDLARFSGIPVINGLSDLLHPCQAIADLLTIQEHKGRLAGLRLAYLGDSNNVTYSLMNASARVGMHMMVGSPAGYVGRCNNRQPVFWATIALASLAAIANCSSSAASDASKFMAISAELQK